MNTLLQIAKWEYLTHIRSKWFIISTLMIPVILILSMVVPMLLFEQEDSTARVIAIVDGTENYGTLLQTALNERYRLKDDRPKYQSVLLHGEDLESLQREARQLLEEDVISSYLVIPADIRSANQIRYYARNLGKIKDQSELQIAAVEVVRRQRMRAAELPAPLMESIIEPIDFQLFAIDAKGGAEEADELSAYMAPMVYVLILFMAIFMSSQVLMRSVIEERRNRLVELLLSSVTPTQLMAGKIAGLGALGLTQLALYFILGSSLASGQQQILLNSRHVTLFIAFFVGGYLFYAAIYAALGSMFTSEHDAQQASSLFSLVSILPIIFSSYIISDPNSVVATVFSMIPFTAPFLMILRIGIEMPPVWEIAGSFVALALSIGLAFCAAGRIFRTALLIYGKRPTFQKIWYWIRQ